jgi:hypothetical protein
MTTIKQLSILPWYNNAAPPALAFTKPMRIHEEGEPCPHAEDFAAYGALQGKASCCALDGISLATAMCRLDPALFDSTLKIQDLLAPHRGPFFRLSPRDAFRFASALSEMAVEARKFPVSQGFADDTSKHEFEVTLCLPPEEGSSFRTWCLPERPMSPFDARVIVYAAAEWYIRTAEYGCGIRYEWSE